VRRVAAAIVTSAGTAARVRPGATTEDRVAIVARVRVAIVARVRVAATSTETADLDPPVVAVLIAARAMKADVHSPA
jgi:hypothetical protein